MTTDSRKLAHAIEKRLHLIADPSIRKDMAALCKHLIAALDERDTLYENCLKSNLDLGNADIQIVRLQAENERLCTELKFYAEGHFGLPCAFCDDGGDRAKTALKENHGKP